MPSILRRVGSKTTERKSGSTLVFTLLVKVWPSLSSFWRWPSTRWPKISWKKTPAARPEKIAGPTNGSASGACSRFGDVVGHAVDGRGQRLVVRAGPTASTASKVSNVLRSVPSAALAEAEMKRARIRGRARCARLRYSRSSGCRSGPIPRRAKSAHWGSCRSATRACGRGRATRPHRSCSLGGASRATSRLLGRKIVRIVGGRHLHLGVGLDADEPLGGGAVGAIRFQPQPPLDGVGDVLEGDERAGGELAAVVPHAVVVVQFGRSDTHRNVQRAGLAVARAVDRPERRRQRAVIDFRDLVAQKVGRRVGFLLQRPKNCGSVPGT